MPIDLRAGWPAQIFSGRYSVTISRRYDIREAVNDELLLGIPDSPDPVPEVRIGGRTMYRLRHGLLWDQHDPPGVVLHLRFPPTVAPARAAPAVRPPLWRRAGLAAWRGITRDATREVVDARLNTVIGALVDKRPVAGLLLPSRMEIYDAAGRLVGQLTERHLLPVRLPRLTRHHRLRAGRVPVAHMRRPWRFLGAALHVDVTPHAAHHVDPRLILAAALLRLGQSV